MAFRSTVSALLLVFAGAAHAQAPADWQRDWPVTDFSQANVPFHEILSGGPPKDGIPSIDDPAFIPVRDADLPNTAPVIGLAINGDARAYPLEVLTWHEIVNDTVGGTPVAITYCPLCNTAIVFERLVDGSETTFGTTGKLRHSDLIMYDRLTESWWQQYTGAAIVGGQTGAQLPVVAARLESLATFRARHPGGRILVPTDPSMRAYGRNPYVGYDDLTGIPFLFRGDTPQGVAPMMRVVAVGPRAWTLPVVQQARRLEANDLVITWQAGQASALDTPNINSGRDVGTVTVQRRTGSETLEDVPYKVTFAFAFFAFNPVDGHLTTADGVIRAGR